MVLVIKMLLKIFSLDHLAPPNFNPLSPKINMHILLSVLHIFLMLLVGRIWINIKTYVFSDHFLYSRDLYV